MNNIEQPLVPEWILPLDPYYVINAGTFKGVTNGRPNTTIMDLDWAYWAPRQGGPGKHIFMVLLFNSRHSGAARISSSLETSPKSLAARSRTWQTAPGHWPGHLVHGATWSGNNGIAQGDPANGLS